MTNKDSSDGSDPSYLDGIDHPYDTYYSQNNGYECGKFYKPILEFLEKHGIEFPSEAKLLGLFSGIGNGEYGLASNVGIANENITLVDKNPELIDLWNENLKDEYFRTHRDGINCLFGRGIFNYLENPDKRDFSVVTAVGAEYLLGNPDVMEIFIRLLPNVLTPNGFVCIYPEVENMQDEIWKACGFEEVKDLGPLYNYAGSRMYVYSNPVKK
jgi:hypothetical protein